jgi:hypothetical protein
MIEDAKIHKRNLYAMYVDLSSAFNCVDHDKLLQLMYDLGFPLESIYVVQGLYTNASTRVHTPCRATPNINIDRGTLQGDTLSPLLFNIFIEPLLRWLQVGGRGYTYGCLKDCDDSAGGKGYADDIAAFAHHARDARIQAAKISRYSDWSDLKVNVTKSAASAILHGDAACGGPQMITEHAGNSPTYESAGSRCHSCLATSPTSTWDCR